MGGRGSGGGREGRRRNPVTESKDPSSVDAGVNARVMAFGRDLFAFERPDLSDGASVEDAFYRYLGLCAEHGIRPMLKSMSAAFGIPDAHLRCIALDDPRYANYKGGILTPESKEAIQKSYNFLAVAWETYLVEERGNPVKWIVLGKNYFGIKDQPEPVQVSIELRPQLRAPDDVMAEYAARVGHPRQERLPGAVEVEATVEDA